MKRAIVATSIALGCIAGTWASPWNKKTTIEVKETILIPGKELPPGKYVLKLADSASNRHIVQIFNADETKVEATILAIPNWRLRPTGKTALGYWETPSGSPPALRSWFYPGDNFGQEFAYPKAMAERLAKLNQEKVPWYEGEDRGEYEVATLREREVYDYDQTPAPETATSQQTETVVERVERQAEPAEREVAAKPEPQEQQVAQTQERETVTPAPRRDDEQLLAQNRNPDPQPRMERETRTQPTTLPETATPYGALLLVGIGLIGLGRFASGRASKRYS